MRPFAVTATYYLDNDTPLEARGTYMPATRNEPAEVDTEELDPRAISALWDAAEAHLDWMASMREERT